MSVLAMLAILWWGLCGFLAVAACGWFFVQSLGRTGRFVVLLIVGMIGSRLLERHFTADERCANAFLEAWAAESADWPKGRVNTRPWACFADYDRLSNPNPYLALQWELRYCAPVTTAGKEAISTPCDPSTVQTKVYLAGARLYNSEHDQNFRAKIRVWVARDTHKVVRYMFEDIVFL